VKAALPWEWEMAATAGEEPPQRSYRAALTKAYRWLLARLGPR
jgi:hypothetical protein